MDNLEVIWNDAKCKIDVVQPIKQDDYLFFIPLSLKLDGSVPNRPLSLKQNIFLAVSV